MSENDSEWLRARVGDGHLGYTDDSRARLRAIADRLEALKRVADVARRLDTVPAMRLDRPTWGEMSDAIDALDALEGE